VAQQKGITDPKKITDISNLYYLGFISSYNYKTSEIILSDFPKELPNLDNIKFINIGFSKNFTQQFKVNKISIFEKFISIKFEGQYTESILQKFIRMAVYIIFDKKDKNTLMPEDILDADVYNIENNELIGHIVDVYLNPVNQIWIVKNPQFELPIPYTENVVKEINLDEKKVYIELIDGLMELAKFTNPKQRKSSKIKSKVVDE